MTPQTLASAPQSSRFHDAYLAIENKIVTLEFRPGVKYTEKAIIDAVEYGRTPVREALQRLEHEGLIEIRPRSGIEVVDIRPEDYVRAIEPRLTLEPLLARSAARYASPRDRETISRVMTDMLAAAGRADVVGYLQADKSLDEAVAGAAANPFLPRILGPLQIHSRRFWYQYHGAEHLKEVADAHADVCKAIVSGDAEAAQSTMLGLMDYLLSEAKALTSS
jgi:DNA-binding GntR family transcriptional regulator